MNSHATYKPVAAYNFRLQRAGLKIDYDLKIDYENMLIL